MNNICIIGSSGLLGSKLIESNLGYNIIGTYNKTVFPHSNQKLIKVNIKNFKDCQQILYHKPSSIINAAAITNVDYCEEFKDEAYAVNVQGTQNLIKIAKSIGSKFIHISSDGIFSGKMSLYDEEQKPEPVNYYGKTKLESEKIVKEYPNHLILRTNLLYGILKTPVNGRSDYTKKTNFPLWILSELQKNRILKIAGDQFSNPTLADNLAKIIFKMIDKNLVGTFHVSDLTCISRYDFSVKIAEKFGHSKNLIKKISLSELNQLAPRPKITCLDCTKIQKYGIKLYTLEESLENFSKQFTHIT